MKSALIFSTLLQRIAFHSTTPPMDDEVFVDVNETYFSPETPRKMLRGCQVQDMPELSYLGTEVLVSVNNSPMTRCALIPGQARSRMSAALIILAHCSPPLPPTMQLADMSMCPAPSTALTYTFLSILRRNHQHCRNPNLQQEPQNGGVPLLRHDPCCGGGDQEDES